MKKFTIVLLFIFICIQGSANSQIRLTIQPGIQVPIGSFSDNAALGIGGHATAEFLRLQKRGIDWSFTLAVGYNYFSGSDDLPAGEDYTYSDIPIMGGLRYYLGKSDFRAYIGAELGFHLLTITTTNTLGTFKLSDTYFGFAPIVGFKSYLSRSTDFDINLKVNSISSENSTLSYLGFNFGIQIALN